MKALMIVLVILLSGCTKYVVEKTAIDGSTTVVRVSSTRDLEQPVVKYTRTGQDATFDFSAASVDNNTEVFMGTMLQMMQMMQQMMLAVPADG